MATLPTFKVLITPIFENIDQAEKVISFDVETTLDSPDLCPGDLIVTSFKYRKTADQTDRPPDYEDCQVVDEQGPLNVEWGPHGDSWALFVSPKPAHMGFSPRDSSGSVSVRYHIALQAEQGGGYIGAGRSFMLNPPLPGSSQCRQSLPPAIYRHIIYWDITNSPTNTRVVSTFGEGPDPQEITGDGETLQNAVYMVGPIQSSPASHSDKIADGYGYYWFMTLPRNIELIRDIHYAFAQRKVAAWFSDPITSSKPYRTFIRDAEPAKGFGNTSFPRSNIFSYDARIDSAQDYDLVRCMAHELIHNFLAPIPNAPHQIEGWLYEGLANALSIYFPFRPPVQFRDGKYFQATLNMLAMKYYTSPLINLSLVELLEQAKTDDYAREQLSARAWAFVVSTDFRARDMACGKVEGVVQRPIEDKAIKIMARKRENGEPYGLQQWFELLEPLMGNEAVEIFEKMEKGKLFIFPEKAFGASTHKMVEKPQEILDFGMDRQSFEKGMVTGLKAESRAQKAGLLDGDKIIDYSYLWRCADDFDAKMQVVIQKGGEVGTRTIEYWPRSFETARCWQLMKVKDL